MAVLAIITSSPPGVEGGHTVIARALARAAREEGHHAHVLLTRDFGFGRTLSSYLENWRLDVAAAVGRPVDQVISLRYPSYAVRHPRHVCWLNHTMREYYDLWPSFSSSISSRARLKEGLRRQLIHAVDRRLLARGRVKVVAQSATIRDRLTRDLGIGADVLLPPPPQRAYRCEGYGDYILSVSRLTPQKRIDLLIRALAEPAARGVRAVIAGEGDERPALQGLAESVGVAPRVEFAGHVTDEALLTHFARCRAVVFAPLREDYGFVTAEAFASSKPVITCGDSGGPTDLVSDGVTGFVCDPTPPALAAALARLSADESLARRLGQAAAARASTMKWPDVVRRLVIV